MSLEHILLGMLKTKPSSGYDLKREFNEAARFFWYAELSQIYPTLKRLEKAGLVRSKLGSSKRGPKRRVYLTTAKGLGELKRWLRDGPKVGTERFAYIAQLYFLHELNDLEESARQMKGLREVWSVKLQALERIERQVSEGGCDLQSCTDAEFHTYAALRIGLHQLRAKVAWCDETLEALKSRKRGRRKTDGPGKSRKRSA